MKNKLIYSIDTELLKPTKGIEMDPGRLGGAPVIKGTRIPVSLIVACLKDNMAFEEICEDYNLTFDNIRDCLDYVRNISDGIRLVSDISNENSLKISQILHLLDEAKFPITDLKQGVMINGIQQTDDVILYDRAVEIIKLIFNMVVKNN